MDTRPSRLHRIAILNRTSEVPDEQVERIAHAIQLQVTEDFMIPWGIGAHIKFVPREDTESWQDYWNVVVVDTSEEADALGYHDLTPQGLPKGTAAWKTTLLDGDEPSGTVSHETLEMMSDPDINLQAMSEDGTIYAYENCDAVETQMYQKNGVWVSNFVYPAYFNPFTQAIKLDHMESLTKPFEIAEGGYMSVLGSRGWTYLTNKSLSRPTVGSRRWRRQQGFAAWRHSRA
jgi:hypothetical protein